MDVMEKNTDCLSCRKHYSSSKNLQQHIRRTTACSVFYLDKDQWLRKPCSASLTPSDGLCSQQKDTTVASHRAEKDADSKAPRPTFQGTGYSVVNINEGSTLVQVGKKQDKTLKLWKNGFSIEDGPLRDYNNPQNKLFLDSIKRGEVPQELLVNPGEVNLIIVDNKSQDFVKGNIISSSGSMNHQPKSSQFEGDLITTMVSEEFNAEAGARVNLSGDKTKKCIHPYKSRSRLPLPSILKPAFLTKEQLDKGQEITKLKQTNEALKVENIQIKNENCRLRKELEGYKSKEFNPEHNTKFLTGISYFWFNFLLTNFKGPCSKKVSNSVALFMTLIYLRHGLCKRFLSILFNVDKNKTSKIIKSTILDLSYMLKDIVHWVDPDTIKHNNRCNKKMYYFRNIISLFDCFEIKTERPFLLNPRAQFWSHYKHHNTIKYFISITPQGTVSFISNGWGGRVSDKEIFLRCGYFEKLEFGNEIGGDRGFPVKHECASRGITCHLPDFTRGKKQLSSFEVVRSRRLAQIRIHVERVIGMLRNFRILNNVFPLKCLDELDDIVFIICALTNLQPPIVKD